MAIDEQGGADGDEELAIRIASSIGAFTPEEWGTLAGASRCDASYNPFISYDFLRIVEESGCAVRATGWQGHHLRLEKPDGAVLGVVPCYLKSHSQGEYVFDHGWADAFERAGGRYYPKLQASVPFTPATGPRLLIRDGVDTERVAEALAGGLIGLCDTVHASSVHVTFAREHETSFLA